MEFTRKEFIDKDLLTGVETAFVNQPYPIRSIVSGSTNRFIICSQAFCCPKGVLKQGVRSINSLISRMIQVSRTANSLAADAEYQSVMKNMLARLDRWKAEVVDRGMKTALQAIRMFPARIDYEKCICWMQRFMAKIASCHDVKM